MRGSLFTPTPLPKTLGINLSRAIACITRGAPKRLPSPDERVAAQTPPAITNGAQKAILDKKVVIIKKNLPVNKTTKHYSKTEIDNHTY